MSKSACLRAADIRAISLLVGECCDLGDDPTVWRSHMLGGLARLIDAGMGLGGEIDGCLNGRRHDLGAADWGWENGFNRAAIVDAVATFQVDPHYCLLINCYIDRLCTSDGICLAWSDMIRDPVWYRSTYFQRIQQPLGADAELVCFHSIPAADDQFSAVFLCRNIGVRDFTARDKAIVAAGHAAIARQIGKRLARFSDPSPSALPPRVRLVLRCLLKGDSDQHIAARMKLSRYTVNEYVDRIYRHFGVQSRPELLARWVRRRWREPLAPAPVDLPPRPRQVLRCLLEGDSNKQVARRLGLSPYTVKEYVKRIFCHFGVQSRQELLARWIGHSEPRP